MSAWQDLEGMKLKIVKIIIIFVSNFFMIAPNAFKPCRQTRCKQSSDHEKLQNPYYGL